MPLGKTTTHTSFLLTALAVFLLLLSGPASAQSLKCLYGGSSPLDNSSSQVFVRGGYPFYLNMSNALFVGSFSGNVGIGTVTPAYRLDVSGDVRWMGTLQGGSVPWTRVSGFTGDATPDTIADDGVISSSEVNFNYAGSSGKGGPATTALALLADGSNCPGGQYAQGVDAGGNAQGCSAPAGGVTGSGTASYLAKWTGGASLGNSIIYDNGNVGIGTASPAGPLHVNSASNYNIYIGNSVMGWGPYSLGTDASGISVYTTAGAPIARFANDKTTYFAGNVGIGTASPSQKLDVAGYVKGQSGLCIGSDCRTGWPAGGISSCTIAVSSENDYSYTGTWLGHTGIFQGNHATCSSGYYLTGGGCTITNYNGNTMDGHPSSGSWWCGFFIESSGVTTAWAVCCK